MKSSPKDSINQHHQYKAALLIFAALCIFLVAVHGKAKSPNSDVPGSTIETMISSIGENSGCGKDPLRAVFLFEPVDLNRADVEVLASLKGIGPAIAKRIVDYRQNTGDFNKSDELLKIKGIGKRKLAMIRDNVTCGNCLDIPVPN